MKQIFTFLAAVLLTATIWAQSPEKMSYQAVIRDSSDALVTNTDIGMQISILQGSVSGTAVYVETQTHTTNANGLVSIELGGGTGVSGNFATIDWANGPYFIKTETDLAGGTNYTIIVTSQLFSVPYSLHSKTAETITGGITETDPVYGSSVASGIISGDITNWNTAFGWGNHATVGYLTSYTETDPLWTASPSFGITNTNISNWNTAYSWGNHATAGYLTSYTETDPLWAASPSFGITNTNISNWNTAYGWGNHATAGYLTSYTETDPLWAASPSFGITNTNITNWNTAFGWGNHATAGYLTSYTETDPLWTASPSFGITNTNISNWNTAYSWGNHATAGYLTSYTETDPVFGASPAIGILSGDITNWNTAFGWGNHATAGYLTSFTEVDGSVTNEIELPTTANAGDMAYWNGTEWIIVTAGNEGQVLTFVSGVPTWKPTEGKTDVTNPITGEIWMDRNLGASQVATSSTDAAAYGDLYQWGRGTDGHEKRTSGTTSTLATSDNPGHGNFIKASNNPYDWRSPKNDNLWQGVSGTNNPCPGGYRLPTEAEWEAERVSWSSNNSAGAYASPLKLSVAGNRNNSNGSFQLVGTYAFYWSGTVVGTDSRYLFFTSSSAYMDSNFRALGFSVRCIKD